MIQSITAPLALRAKEGNFTKFTTKLVYSILENLYI